MNKASDAVHLLEDKDEDELKEEMMMTTMSVR